MLNPRSRETLACLIVSRNLGDAVIQSGFLKSLVERQYAERYVVWTRPQMAFLFRDMPQCEVVCSQFPVGTRKDFSPREAIRFFRTARRIRRCAPTVSIDLIGDFRERIFARLAGSRRHVHIGWARGHPFSRIIRNPFGTGSPTITIPAHTINIYSAYQLILNALAPGAAQSSAAERAGTAHSGVARRPRIGLHPFASQECKLWPAENWGQLIGQLLDEEAEIWAFGAPSDRQALVRLLGGAAGRVRLVVEDIESFSKELGSVDVLVGLDSFAIHLAWREGVRSVMINAGNPPGFWSGPSLGSVLANSGGCSHYPCFNAPRCKGSRGEYACVKAISVAQVLESVKAATQVAR